MNRISTLVLFLLLSISHSFSQIVTSKNLSVEDGLVYSQVLCAYQDKQGYMWFGTSSGVSRWDGRSFKNFHSTDKIRFDNVKLIYESIDGTLVFITRNKVIFLHNNMFQERDDLPPELQNWIQYVVHTEDGNLFLAAQDSGIWKFDGKQFSQLIDIEALGGATVTCLYAAGDGSVLVGTDAHGIFRLKYDDSFDVFWPASSAPKNISTLHQDLSGITYIGTKGNGLYKITDPLDKKLRSVIDLPGSGINYMYTDKKNKVYVATDNGVAVLSNGSVQSVITFMNGLSYGFVWWIAVDRQGNFYFCTDGGGVDIYRPGVYQTYNQSTGLPANTVWSILESSDSKFYFATDRGVAVINSKQLRLLRIETGLSENMIIKLFEAKDGTLFFGTNASGVDILSNGRFVNLNASNGLTSNSVWSIAEDYAGRIYFGTYDGGICVYHGGQIIDTIDTKDGLANNYIVSAYSSADGTLYFGLDNGGLYHLVDGQLHADEVFLSGLTVWSIYENAAGVLFLGTDKTGLIIADSTKIDTLTIADGLSNNAILGIMEDDSGKLYLTTDNGLNIIDLSFNQPRIRIVTSEDGLASNECNQGAYFKDSQGFLWIGTIRGVTRYNPGADKPSLHPPQIHITHMKVFDRDVPVNSGEAERIFEYNENYIQFYFTGIDLTAPHKVLYRYRLNGSDHEWLGTDYPQVQYANLNDNEYIFEVQAGNEWGAWSPTATIRFTILAPFWETWWFRVLVLVAVGGLVGGLVFLRVRSLLEIEKVRSKIAADLHDDIGAGLSEINILSAVAAAKTPEDVKTHTHGELSKIALTAQQMIENMSDIVWMVNPQKDSMIELISRLKDNFNEVFDAKQIVFKTTNLNLLEKIKLSMERRQFIFLIFKEAINNAIKYSECTEIQVDISLHGKSLEILFSDNGKGFDVNKIREGNGLNNMRNRAAKMGARLDISSTIDEGTRITFNGTV